MRTTYQKDDVILLLKDISGQLAAQPTAEREKRIQQGIHYSEMLPIEYTPSPSYMQAYEQALAQHADLTASAVKTVAERIWAKKGHSVVLVSLARAGIPIGILIKHYLQKTYAVSVPHYAISIIRGRGIDHNAMKFLLQTHRPEQIQFIDGWTGKGAICTELENAMKRYPAVSPSLAVLADPAHIVELCGTHRDFLIPSACLNATVCGLISRTVLRSDLIQNQDFHGAVFYDALRSQDRSYDLIQTIEASFARAIFLEEENVSTYNGLDEANEIAHTFHIDDINLIKPGIGETTRVLLRRVPYIILIHPQASGNDIDHIIQLAKEKHVPVEVYPLQCYHTCGIIQTMRDV